MAGGLVRRHLSTTTYTTLCYGTSAAVLLVAVLVSGVELTGYAADDWLKIAALTVLAQLLGHTLFNRVLRSTSPTLVSLATLFTVPLAAVLAALLLEQTPPHASSISLPKTCATRPKSAS